MSRETDRTIQYLQEINNLIESGVDGRIILAWILVKQCEVGTELNWLLTATSNGTVLVLFVQ